MTEKTIPEYTQIMTDLIEKRLGLVAVKSSLTDHLPPYPYASFTITGINYHRRTYGVLKDCKFVPATISVSWTVQSDKDSECWEKVQKLHEFFSDSQARLDLEDAGLTVGSVGDIAERDNMLTIEYEFRKGFDITINTLDIIRPEDGESTEVIETFEPHSTLLK